MFQEVPKDNSLPQWLYMMIGAILLVITNGITSFITFKLSRPKTEAEIHASETAAEKNEAEAMKLKADTVEILLGQINNLLEQAKNLRIELGAIEEAKEELDDTVKQVRKDNATALDELHQLFEEEKKHLRKAIDKAITAISKMIEEMKEKGVEQTIRMKAVSVLELLYNIRTTLEK